MSHSLKICRYNRVVSHAEVVTEISNALKVSKPTVTAVLREYCDLIQRELIEGNAVVMPRICKFHLRRRDYDKERRAKFNLNDKAVLPEFCYYPYALMSMPFRQDIANAKYDIAKHIGEPAGSEESAEE